MAEMITAGELLYFCEESHDALLVQFCIACKDTDLVYWLEQYVLAQGADSTTFRYDPEAFVTFLVGNLVVKPVPYREVGVGDFRQLPSWMPVEGRVSERVGRLLRRLRTERQAPESA